MDLMELYQENENFRQYVDKYSRHYGLSFDEVINHKMVYEYAHYLLYPEENIYAVR